MQKYLFMLTSILLIFSTCEASLSSETDYNADTSEKTKIILDDTNITINGNGVTVSGSTIMINSAGTYEISGSIDDGQVIVDNSDDEKTTLILNSVDIHCSESAPIYIVEAKKVMLVLAEGSKNVLSDSPDYNTDNESNESNATVFSKCNMTIYGKGSLSVDANYNDGIVSKDGLIITSGSIDVKSKDDGIYGKDYIAIQDGNITIEADGIGLKSDNSNDISMGYISIQNANIEIDTESNAIDAEKEVLINSGNLELSADGKGVFADISVIVKGGDIAIAAKDDAMHSNGIMTLNDGTYTLSASDDAIHSNNDLIINDGIINITKSNEGVESGEGDININGGEIYIFSSDDGLNLAAGGSSGDTNSSTDNYLSINGGHIVVNANGDGIDANDNVSMTGGNLIVSGSSANSNSALDYDGSFTMDGGFMVASGSSKMAKAPGTSSSQYSILVNFATIKDAGTLIHIETEDGDNVLTYSPAKSYQSVAFSSDKLEEGSTYKIYVGGSTSGIVTDGIYNNGTYSDGLLFKSFTISSRVTTII